MDDAGGYADGSVGNSDSLVATAIPSVTLPLKTMHPVLWMIQGATSTILVAAPPVIGAPLVISLFPFQLLQKPLRRISFCKNLSSKADGDVC